MFRSGYSGSLGFCCIARSDARDWDGRYRTLPAEGTANHGVQRGVAARQQARPWTGKDRTQRICLPAERWGSATGGLPAPKSHERLKYPPGGAKA